MPTTTSSSDRLILAENTHSAMQRGLGSFAEAEPWPPVANYIYGMKLADDGGPNDQDTIAGDRFKRSSERNQLNGQR